MADTLSQALLEASLLSSIPEEDEGSVIIDVDRRTMVLPTGFFFGVYNDKDILKVPFVIPRYYNELDLSEFQITVNYINSAGYGNIYRVTDAEVTDSAIRFKWVTGRGVFAKEGTVRFIVCLRQIGASGEVEKEFNTTIASANVLKGLEVDENPDPVAYSILAHMEELKDQAEAAVEVAEGAADRIDNAVTEAEQAIAAMYHSPYIAPTAADMLSHDKVYVYTGNETGYTFGNWYYWNGSAFVSGGVYNATAFETDATLTQSGKAADAKKTGDEISGLKEESNQKPDARESDAEGVDLDVVDQNGNVIVRFKNGHIEVKNFNSSDLPSIASLEAAVALVNIAVKKVNNATPDSSGNVAINVGVKTINGETPDSSGDIEVSTEAIDTIASSGDLYLCDQSGNVIAYFANGHIITKNFNSSDIVLNPVKTVNNISPDSSGNVTIPVVPDPSDVSAAVEDYLDEHPVVAAAAGIVSVADYGAVGDGETDDSAAIQNAVDANYDVYFESNKTYYIASTITINHDIKLHGGQNTIIKTKTPTGGIVNTGISVQGTKKKTTTLTSDYVSNGSGDNCNNRFTFSDMTGIGIGDIFVIKATDQYYNYDRPYYYLGGTLIVTDIYDGHIYSGMNLPWDIQNTTNVSVEVYDAPVVVVDNLHFVSDRENLGHYKYCLSLQHCKFSVVQNCTFTMMNNGLYIGQCINCKVEGVMLSKSKYDNNIPVDGYGIGLYSSTNTVLERIIATCAQHAITVSGEHPSINTYVCNCDLTAECRQPGLDTHECTYNLIVEDSILGAACINGTAIINRCRIINNRRVSNGQIFISLYGSHNPKWSKIKISNTVFDGAGIYISTPYVQSPVQAYDNILDTLEIENCHGGVLFYNQGPTSTILSNTIRKLSIKNWVDCSGIIFDGTNRIEELSVEDSTFTNVNFISDNTEAHGVITSNIGNLDVKSVCPRFHKVSVHNPNSMGENYILPENVSIQLSSNNNDAKYIVCGSKITSDNANDYTIGTVSGSVGGLLTRTEDSGSAASLAINNGKLIYTQGSNTTKLSFYPMRFYVKEASQVTISATLKNTGSTNGATFIPEIAIVDGESGKVTYFGTGNGQTATQAGVIISHTRKVKANSIVLCCMYCSTAISGAESTFEDFAITCVPLFAPAPVSNVYIAQRLTGDGTILSLDGVNNIMSSEDTFSVRFAVDYSSN